jgi:hypothetical protein
VPSRITLSIPRIPAHRQLFNFPRRRDVQPAPPPPYRHTLWSPWDAERVHTALIESGDLALASVLVSNGDEERIVYVNRSFVVLVDDVPEQETDEAAEEEATAGAGG